MKLSMTDAPVLRRRRQRRCAVATIAAAAACCATVSVLTVKAFVPAARTSSTLRSALQPEGGRCSSGPRPQPDISGSGVGAVVGFWGVAGTVAAVSGRRRSSLSLRAEHAEQQEPELTEEEACIRLGLIEAKKPFDVWETETWGNISMTDVKKYGVAGTLSYVLTELAFWAIAFPTECFAYLNSAGHWPDFSKPEESAAVFGLVFAASNIARLLLPLRFGAALALAPWVDANIVQRFGGKKEEEANEGA
mmetsp:Transcript_9824/g.15600  ORF Transcript_9824/g.15600 Transcript_9824/m.15600 type:complete len:249 (-) Transcript_9824:94-840(-)